MSREYTDDWDHDFWCLAERVLGVNYGEVSIKVVGSVVQIFVTEDPHKSRQADSFEELRSALTKEALVNAFTAFKGAVGRKQWESTKQQALAILEVDHTVLVGGKGEKPEAVADNARRAAYWADVHATAEQIKQEVLDGELPSNDDVWTRIREQEIVYTHEALEVLRWSNNDSQYWDEYGGGSEFPGWETLASAAYQQDILDNLPFDPYDISEQECARCGVVYAVESDPTDCPKCGLSLSVTEERGGFTEENAEGVCTECANNAHMVLLPPDQIFECASCGETFVTPKEET